MSIEQYWMGKGLDLDALWNDYDAGSGYVQKVSSAPTHLLRLKFDGHPETLPLFDFEVLYKTVKGTFHDVKAECFTPDKYDKSTPIFLHRVARGSGIFEFLGQFDPIMTWIVGLAAASSWYRKKLAADQELDEKRLAFLRKEFPGAGLHDVQVYMKAWTTSGRRKVLHRLLGQLKKVEVSRDPHDPVEAPPMVDMETVLLLEEADA